MAALRCPDCRSPLDDLLQTLRCSGCGQEYPLVNGVPVLMNHDGRLERDLRLNSAGGRRMKEEYEVLAAARPAEPAAPGAWRRLAAMLKPPGITLHYHPDIRLPPTDILWQRDGRSQLTLNVGGGPCRESDSPDEITLNLEPFHNVDLVGDAHNLPFADDSFDSVISMAVLEHVSDPYRVVAEMLRVLKPGGYLYSEVPFLFFYHGYPADFSRFTHQGMEKLFSGLEDCRIDMTNGPVSAVLQSANMLVEVFVPARRRYLRKAANGLFRWLFFPFKYLDLLVRDRPAAQALAGGFYVLGRKPDTAGGRPSV